MAALYPRFVSFTNPGGVRHDRTSQGAARTALVSLEGLTGPVPGGRSTRLASRRRPIPGMVFGANSLLGRRSVASNGRIDVRKTYKLYIGGAFPRSESGRSYVVSSARGEPLANAVRGSARISATQSGQHAPRPSLGRQDGDEPRPGPLSGRGADGGPARPVRRRGQPRPRGSARPRARERRRPGHRPLGLVRRLGRQDRPGARDRRTRSPRRTSTSRSPSRRASSGSSRPRQSSLLGLVSRLAPPLVAGNAVVVLASETRPLPAITLDRGPRHVRRSGRRRQRPDRAEEGARARCWPAHVDVDAIDVWGVPADCGPRPSCSPPTGHQANLAPAGRRHRREVRLARRPRRRAPRVDRRVPRDEDGLAPDRGLGATGRVARPPGSCRCDREALRETSA